MATKKYSQTPADRAKQLAYERVSENSEHTVTVKILCMPLQQEQKKKQWKRKHEEFIDTIRSAREYDAATKTGNQNSQLI